MRSPLESNYSFSKTINQISSSPPKKGHWVPFFTEKTILDNIIKNLRNSRMNYLARKPIINFDLYSTPFSRIREEKVSGRKRGDKLET
jgi:hypothetical protein